MRFLPILAVMVSGCTAAPVAPQTLLASWQRVGDAGWRMSDGSLVAGPSEATGFLVSPQRWDDFTLTVEFRIDDDTNSGIFIRCRDASRITPFDCYEINIWDNHPNQDFRTGSVVTRQVPLARVETLGRWNRMKVVARANRVTVTVNDIVTARLEDESLAAGHIAVQYAGTGTVAFRELHIVAD